MQGGQKGLQDFSILSTNYRLLNDLHKQILQERYQKFSSNPPIRHKRKADRLKIEEEDRAKRLKLMQGSQQQQPPLDNNNTKMATPTGTAEQAATTTESTPVTGGSGAINGIEGSASGSPESSADKSSTPTSDSPKVSTLVDVLINFCIACSIRKSLKNNRL